VHDRRRGGDPPRAARAADGVDRAGVSVADVAERPRRVTPTQGTGATAHPAFVRVPRALALSWTFAPASMLVGCLSVLFETGVEAHLEFTPVSRGETSSRRSPTTIEYVRLHRAWGVLGLDVFHLLFDRTERLIGYTWIHVN
jgi:hypothetical protein